MLASYALDYDAQACSEHKTKACLGHNRSFCEALLNFNPTMLGAAQHTPKSLGRIAGRRVLHLQVATARREYAQV